ncbi:hypothetical protein [Sphingomonas sp. LR55]|uniref:hypothetical protein n=1 Tax=Sphingomonas sp. LR55 TaxID=3050231 RepID=UPI003FA71925
MPETGPEWLYEAGIGEARAALVDDDQILEAAIELDDSTALKVGLVARARLVELLPGRRGRVTLDGGEALINYLPRHYTRREPDCRDRPRGAARGRPREAR